MGQLVIAIHGGAGSADEDACARTDETMREGLREALAVGYERLERGGSALDAVEASVRHLEANALFNAGRGSVLTSEGRVQMDAAIMSGVDRSAGAIAAVPAVVHPISAARKVMEDSPHVLLVGADALAFCQQKGLHTEAPAYFVTELRKRQLARAQRDGAAEHEPSSGTVGAVARDGQGNLAAATSTGGMSNQLPGRVGDSPLIGAGTWADNETCAVSVTGSGETIVRASVAHNIDALLRYSGLDVGQACRRSVDRVVALGGEAGCIAVDRRGRVAMPFSTPIMARGVMRTGSEIELSIGRGSDFA